MLRPILGTLAGVVVGVFVVGLVESVGHMIFPPPEGVNLKNPEELTAIMNTIPLGAKISVLIAWGIGVFVGGVAALFIAKSETWPVWAVGAVLLLGGFYTMTTIPHPIWMILGAVLVTLAGAYGALKVTSKRL